MIIFPAIDLKAGEVVRLAEGDMDRATVYGDNPAAQAMMFAVQGAEFLHVVDLDGSFAGRTQNREAVEAIRKDFPGDVQLGGGIRDGAGVEGWFNLGVSRVVMGSAALKNPEFVKDMAREWENGIVVAVDARDGMVATEGWAEVSDVPVVDLARRFEDAGVAALLFTDMRAGFAAFARYPGLVSTFKGSGVHIAFLSAHLSSFCCGCCESCGCYECCGCSEVVSSSI